ncbi:MAG TPA: GDSL-type esterase/lipase family protein [Opitutaceae bacterium]
MGRHHSTTPDRAAIRRITALGLIVFLAGIAAPVALPKSASQDWSADMARFAHEDAGSPTPDGCVLFVGSSSIRLWGTLATDFPEVTVLNRGFGGSHIADSIVHFDRLVAPHNPRLIVFYAGTNDIAAGRLPEDVAADFREFCSMLHAAKPEARVMFISLQFAPSRWNLREKVALTNAYVAAFCAADPRRTFVDSNSVTMSADGRPRPELYVGDQLHMNAAGYEVWADLLRPLVQPKSSD